MFSIYLIMNTLGGNEHLHGEVKYQTIKDMHKADTAPQPGEGKREERENQF